MIPLFNSHRAALSLVDRAKAIEETQRVFTDTQSRMKDVDRAIEIDSDPNASAQLEQGTAQDLEGFLAQDSGESVPVEPRDEVEGTFEEVSEAHTEGEDREQALLNEEKARLDSRIQEYAEAERGNGREPFSLAPVIQKMDEAKSNMKRFEQLSTLLDVKDEHFAKEASRYGLNSSRYQRLAELDPKGARASAELKLLQRELFPEAKGARGELLMAKELGLESYSPEAARAALPGYLAHKQQGLDIYETAPNKAWEAFTSEKGLIGQNLDWLEEIPEEYRKEASAVYTEQVNQLAGEYADIREFIRPMVEEIKSGLFSGDQMTGKMAEYSELSEDQRKRLFEAIGQVSQSEGVDIDGWWANVGTSLFRSVENLGDTSAAYWTREERRTDEKIIETGRITVSNKTSRNSSKPEEREATPEEIELAKSRLGVRQFFTDIRANKDSFRRTEKDKLRYTVPNAIAGSLPHFLFASNPYTVGIVSAPSYIESAREDLLAEAPDIDPETADELSAGIGAVQAGVERLSFVGLFGKSLSKPLMGAVRGNTAAYWGARFAAGTVTESTEEIVQELTYHVGKEVGSQLDASVPQARWGEAFQEIGDNLPEIILTSAFFAAAGSTIRTKNDAEIGRAIKAAHAEGQLEASLLSPEAIERVMETEGDVQRAEAFREEVANQDPEERLENAKNLDALELAKKSAEAEEARQADLEFVHNRSVTEDALEHFQNYGKDTGLDITVKRTDGEKVLDRVTETNRESILAWARESIRADGEDVSQLSDEQILDRQIEGSVQIRQDLAGISVSLAKSANVATAVEEVSEGVYRIAEAKGEIDSAQFVADLRAIDSNLVPQEYESLPRESQNAARVEAFSNFVKGYAIERSVQEDNPDFEGGPLALPASVSGAFKKLFYSATRFFRVAVETAKAIMTARENGNLSQDLTALADRALGLDYNYLAQKQEEASRKEILEETQPDRVKELVKGKLPRPDDPSIAGDPDRGLPADPLKGELQEIWGAFQTKAKGRGKHSKAAAFFAPKGEGVELDRLRQSLNEEGFEFETPSEMLQAIYEDVNEGATSFSIEKQLSEIDEAVSEAQEIYENEKESEISYFWEKEERDDYAEYYYADELETAESLEHLLSDFEAPSIYRNNGEETYLVGGEEEFKTFEEAESYADELIRNSWREEANLSHDAYGTRDNSKNTTILILDSFPYLESVTDSWAVTKWGSAYLSFRDEEGELQKISIRDHSASKSHGIPDKSFFVSKEWSPEEVGKAAKDALEYIHENAPAQSALAGSEYASRESSESGLRKGLSNNDTESTFFSISPQQDADYLKAVEAGDMETAQEMVDEAAKAAGYDSPKVYHGTTSEDFEVIDLQLVGRNGRSEGGGFYTTTNKEEAENYRKGDGRVLSAFIRHSRYIAGEYIPTELEVEKIKSAYITIESETNSEISREDIEDEISYYEYAEESIVDLQGDLYSAGMSRDSVNKAISEALDTDGFKSIGYDNEKRSDLEIFVTLQSPFIKKSDPVTHDESGAVIPLSQRFDENREEISFSVRTTKQISEIEAELDKLFVGVADKVKVGEKIKKRIRLAQADWEKGTYGGGKRTSQKELDTKALANLDAVIGALPIELRGRASLLPGVGKRTTAATHLLTLKTQGERNAFIIARLAHVEQVLENYLQKEYKRKIKRQLDQAKPGKTNQGNARAKMTAFGHRVFHEIQEVLSLDDIDVRKRGEAYEEKTEQDSFEHDDEKAIAQIYPYLEKIFGEYGEADTNRLADALEFVTATYKLQRDTFLKKLESKKEERDARLASLAAVMDQKEIPNDDEVNSPQLSAGMKLTQFSGRALRSGLQLFDLLATPTGEYDAIDPLNKSIRDSVSDYQRRQLDFNKSLKEKLKEIAGGSQRKADKWLYKARTEVADSGVSFANERQNQKTSVNKQDLEDVLTNDKKKLTVRTADENGNTHAVEIEIDADTRQNLTRAWEKFQDLPLEVQSRRRVVQFFHNFATKVDGAEPRRNYENLTQMKALHLKLMIERPSMKAKMFRAGYDEVTLAEINNFLDPETLELGRWMVENLQETGKEVGSMFEDIKNLPFAFEKGYFPASFDPAFQGSQDGLDPKGEKEGRRGVEGGFLKAPVHHNAPPKPQDALDVFSKHAEESSHYVTHARFADEWGKVFRDRSFRRRAIVSVGEKSAQAIINQVELIEAGFSPASQINSEIVNFHDKLRQNVTKTTLGLRLSTIAVQLSATAKLTQALPANKLAAGIVKAVANPSSVSNAWNSPAMKLRVEDGSRVIQINEDQGVLSGRPLLVASERLSNSPFALLRYGEGIANNITGAVIWQYHHDEGKKNGLSDKQAKELADEELSKALAAFAQPTQSQNLSLFGQHLEQSKLGRIVMPFTSEPMQNIGNALGVALHGAITGKGRYSRGHSAQILLTSWAILGAVEAVIRAGLEELQKEEDDEKGFSKLDEPGFWIPQLVAGPLNFAGIPKVVFDSIQEYHGNKTYSGGTLTESVLGEVRSIPRVFDDSNSPEERVDHALDALKAIGSLHKYTVIFAQAASLTDQGKDLYLHAGDERYFSDEERFKAVMSDLNKLSKLHPMKDLKGSEKKAAEKVKAQEYEELIRGLLPPDKIEAFLQGKGESLPGYIKKRFVK